MAALFFTNHSLAKIGNHFSVWRLLAKQKQQRNQEVKRPESKIVIDIEDNN